MGLKENADKISKIVINTSTEERGILFGEIAKCLRQQGQNFSGSLFEDISVKYGTPE